MIKSPGGGLSKAAQRPLLVGIASGRIGHVQTLESTSTAPVKSALGAESGSEAQEHSRPIQSRSRVSENRGRMRGGGNSSRDPAWCDFLATGNTTLVRHGPFASARFLLGQMQGGSKVNQNFGCRYASVLLIAIFLFPTHAPASPPGQAADEAVSALSVRLGMTEAEVRWHLERQGSAISQELAVRKALGSDYSGSWYDEQSGDLVVATTRRDRTAHFEAPGVRLVSAAYTLEALIGVLESLVAEGAILGWKAHVSTMYVDEVRNRVQVNVLLGSMARVASDVAQLGLPPHSVALVPVNERVLPFAAINGGKGFDNVTSPNTCTIGFSVQGGFITAAHCGYVGHNLTAANGSALGTVSASTFQNPPPPCTPPSPEEPYPDARPTSDYAFVQTTAGWTPSATVGVRSSMPINVQAAATGGGFVGLYVCRYGATTGGPHCGRTVSYYGMSYFSAWPNIGIPIYPLVVASVCGAHGDSGGPLVNPNLRLAIGMLHGGPVSGCPGNPDAYPTMYSKVTEALANFGLTLTVQP